MNMKMKRRTFTRSFRNIISILLIIFLLSSYAITSSETTTLKTQTDVVTWANSLAGQLIDLDHKDGGQCVELIKVYYAYLGVPTPTGHAYQYWTNPLPSGWDPIKNTPDFVPQAGDIAVWDQNVGKGYGHVAIVLSGNSKTFDSMDQNWPEYSAVKKVTHNYNHLIGFIRPKLLRNLDIPLQWVFPLSADASSSKVVTTQAFGSSGHLGIDLAISGAPNQRSGSVRAAADGEIVYAGSNGNGFGYHVIMKHTNSALNNSVLYTLYGHMKENSLTVTTGQKDVKSGTVIGIMGNTGISTGPHLHFEIKTVGRAGYGYTKDKVTINEKNIYDRSVRFYAPIDYMNDQNSANGYPPALSGTPSIITNPTTPSVSTPPGQPLIVSPSNQSIFTNSDPTFSWNSISSPSGKSIRYNYEVFDSPLNMTGSTYSLSFKPQISNKSGTYSFRVQAFDEGTGKAGSWSNPISVNIQAGVNAPPSKPIITYPLLDAVLTEVPTLTWQESTSPNGNPIEYNVIIDADGYPQKSGIALLSWTPPIISTDRTYMWSITAKDTVTGLESSVYSRFTIKKESFNTAPSVPTGYSPYSWQEVNAIPTLFWNPVSTVNGGSIQYKVETYDSPSNYSSDWISSTSHVPNWIGNIAGNYYWRVKSRDTKTGLESNFSAGMAFVYKKVELNPPGAPMPLSPSDYAKNPSSAPTIKWGTVSSPSGSATQYQVEIFDSSLNPSSNWFNGTEWRPSELDGKPGIYTWHVRAKDPSTGKVSSWSNPLRFEITKAESTNLRLDIRMVNYGTPSNFPDVTQKVRSMIVNDESVTIIANNTLTGYDPESGKVKILFCRYRNRWNEEYEFTINENQQITITRDSRYGTFKTDGDW